MNPNTIEYLGYQIDPVKEAGECWVVCPVEEATFFEIFPPDVDEPKLDVEAYTLETAKQAVELDIDIREGAPF